MAALILTSLVLFPSAALGAGEPLAPRNDINLPRGANARSPLQWLGANGPWFAGPNVHSISPDVPASCTVDMAATVSRHGARYPDQGAYDGWVSMHSRFAAAQPFTAAGALSFLPGWEPVLTDPTDQVAMENPTGTKEAHDFGYALRTRYPQLYSQGDPFYVWANNYTRVLQTAKSFAQGFLGAYASRDGRVVSVSGEGFAAGIGDSLAPSDMCPLFEDDGGADEVAAWNAVWIPPVKRRLQRMIVEGDLELTDDDVSQGPYLCGFESSITGRLSPWCDVFTDEELRSYEYFNDLRYYYGVGPGTDLPSKMMTPYLDALMGLFAKGPGLVGTGPDGGEFQVPRLLVSFLNDGQLTELVTASGVFDKQKPLNPKRKDDGRLWVGNRYVTQRGTIAFERLNCEVEGKHGHSGNETYVRILLNDAVWPVPSCQSGPGRSCPLDQYVDYIKDKYEAQGDWLENCNVTMEGAPEKVKGASFYTDLSSEWLQIVPPYN